ncbi:TPA: amidohydrolase/deacetylase family metallohydrolase [Candidatus Poribacteria bacterium]|nr:amidohydrolase/deacetylase family metallohydrolase [Candidatus Poribacteria bacterium]HIB91733.1 amidohydrolase/deacetylase family metallohydrolase [Candidatus Poribacteria bacterium]HIB98690.1 amidohydrolase/deacetylase family metallohydrolase [Candidatus Poribacteria bacterium]HIN28418.1 amidohydrolase/deacetylase family metallohydrolase [Candidatus Poribacteria bacterium]HIO08723.1 amidohydrolase/deacetylase family metallohydrolase [Candidatus Poribacteria bacterium]
MGTKITSMEYDILLKDGTVIAPSEGLNDQVDVAIANGQVAAVSKNIDPQKAERTISVSGKYVVPGLVDIHAHVYVGVTTWGVAADPACQTTGVTTIVDAGSSGWATFSGFRNYIVQPTQTRILCYLHISGIGLVYGPVGEMLDLRYADPGKVADTIIKNRDLIVGVKVRQGGAQVGDNGVEPLKLAIEAAERAGVPVMCHIGAGVSLPEILKLMRPRDVITHCFQGRGDSILDEKGRVIPDAWAARQDGVIFDVGHGGGSFSYDVAKQAMEQGFISDVISTDLHTGNINGPVYNLPTTLSKFLHLGLSLEEVIEKATIQPAKAIQRDDEIGRLKIGSPADITVLDLLDGEFEFFDTHRKMFVGNQKLEAIFTINQQTITECVTT